MASDSVRRALSYPFEIPSRSYVVAGVRYEELPDGAPLPDVAGRHPVLALGSNQSPQQLIRKFKDRGLGPIPVVRGRLHDFDIVYAAHVAAYGSIPATLRHCPGAAVTLFVNWLDEAQLARMHETETATGNYHFGRLDVITLRLEIGGDLTSAFLYDHLAPGQPLNAFIQAAVDDRAVRLARTEALMADSLAFEHLGFAAIAL